jgi:hypothetical protein
MAKKAQVEIVVIVGVLLLGIAVVYYAVSGGFPSSNIPRNLYDRQKAFHDSFVSLARRGADNALQSMETHGGYPTAELLGNGTYQIPPFVVFMGEGVPYWTMCEQDVSPSRKNITRWLELSLENYIREHITEVTDSYGNVTIDLSKLSVSASILSTANKIDIAVNLPTAVDGYKMVSQFYPYKTSLNSKFGEIYDFADNFSKAQAAKRFLEVFTTASVYLSADAQDGYPKLPTGGFLTSCGETIYRTPQQISGYLKDIAEHVLTQTLWWQSMPADPSKPKAYSINREIIGTEYRDLDISMYLPDGFSFDTGESVVIMNNKPAYTSSVWTASDCLGVYSIGYSVSYPVIVRVKDPLSGYYFNFAVLVFVDGNAKDNGKTVLMGPGKCGDIKSGEDSCKQMGCSAKINVADEKGGPIEGATASFGGCGLGVSDSSGTIEGKIKCGTNELGIYRNSSYDFYRNSLSSSEINGTYALPTIADLTIRFRKVVIMQSGTQENKITKCVMDNVTDYVFADFASNDHLFAVTNIDSQSIPADCMNNTCLEQCQNSNDMDQCRQCSMNCMGDILESVKVLYMPAGNYDLNVTQLNPGTLKETGGFLSGYTVRPVSSIYLNIPEIASGPAEYHILDGQKTQAVQSLSECSINPVSENTYPKTTFALSCTCDSLETLMDDIMGPGCPSLTQNDIDSMFCRCPSATGYPSNCGQCSEAQCGTCCAPAKTITDFAASKCGIRVVCK